MRSLVVVLFVVSGLACSGFADKVQQEGIKQTLTQMRTMLNGVPDAAAREQAMGALERLAKAAKAGSVDLVEVVEISVVLTTAVEDQVLTADEIQEFVSKVDAAVS